MRRPHLIAAFAATMLLAGLLAGCSPAPSTGGSSYGGSEVPTPQAPAGEATASVEATVSDVVRIETSEGDVTIELYAGKAPLTVANFMKLVKSGFYEGVLVHRVEPGFVAQMGDPLTKGLGAKKLADVLARQKAGTPSEDDPRIGGGGPGWTIPLEISDLVHDRGVIAMARTSEPDTAGSQFYITLAAAHFLDGQYAVFGRVTDGMDVVDRLAVGDAVRSITIIGK